MQDMTLNEWPALYEAPYGGTGKKYIFISYSHEDSDIVYQDLKLLSNNGARLWYDKAMHVGQNWVERAKNKIFDKNCAAVIFYVSANSLSSSAFMQELGYAIQRQQEDTTFTYISVNIGELSAFELLKTIDIDESSFLKALLAFNGEKLFIPRKKDPFDSAHIIKLIDIFEDTESIDLSKCTINQALLFEYAEFEQELQIKKYRGSDSIVNLPSISNGKKVVAIGINAFKNNTSLKRVNVPEGYRIIDDFAFSGCVNLESIALPNSLISLGYESFRECYSLNDIVIPYNVNRIGDYCFYKCHHLKSVSLLSAVSFTIGFATFSECHTIDNIVLPETTVEIGPYAFNNCINIVSITIPMNLRKIGLSAFYNCASLGTVIIRTKHCLVNNKWFARCRNLRSIQVDAGQMNAYIDEPSWNEHQSQLMYKLATPSNVSYDAGIVSWDNIGLADTYTVRINEVLNETTRPLLMIPVSEAGKKYAVSIIAHSYDSRIMDSDMSTEIEISANQDVFETQKNNARITLIKYNGNYSKVVIPEEITDIGENAFYNHEEIKEILLHEGILTIGNRAFYHCLGLQNIQFPNSLTEIGNEAFWGAAFKTLIIPQGVQRIGESCFACCNSLEELTIQSKDTISGEKAFYRCINLKRVNLPNDYTELYKGMFRGCTELDSLVLPAGLKAIRTGAISYIMRLQRVFIPSSVELIEGAAFTNSFGLTEIYVDEQNRQYFDRKGVLFSKDDMCLLNFPADKDLIEYVIDDDILQIADFAFMDTEHVEKITIGKGVHIIGESAFARCPSLKEVYIKGEVETIKKNAFRDCINLKRMFLLSGAVPEIEKGLFDNVATDFKIIVPEIYIRNYLRITDWKDYHYLIQPLKDEKNRAII